MAAQTITVARGEDVVQPINADPATNITGWTIAFQLKKTHGSTSTVLATGTVTPVTLATGAITVTLLSADLDRTPGVYEWELWRTDAGSRRRLAYGPFHIEPTLRF